MVKLQLVARAIMKGIAILEVHELGDKYIGEVSDRPLLIYEAVLQDTARS